MAQGLEIEKLAYTFQDCRYATLYTHYEIMRIFPTHRPPVTSEGMNYQKK